jgi:DNA repair protein RecO (recombination protein O)
MEWRDQGIVLSVRKHGETSALVELLTRDHGRHLGLARGGFGKRMRGVLQPGNTVSATWRARLAEHLGNYSVELANARAARVLDNKVSIEALRAIAALTSFSLPERERHIALYDGMEIVFDALDDPEVWPALVVRWELALLDELGFGLDLTKCAGGGPSNDLAFVSPKSGRAVSREMAAPYKERMLPLPKFLLGSQNSVENVDDVLDGLRLTGFFLERRLYRPHDRKLPDARQRLAELLHTAARKAQ